MRFMKRNILLFSLVVFMFTACQLGDLQYVDFTQVDSVATSSFRVYKQRITQLAHLFEDEEQLALWGFSDDSSETSSYRANGPLRATSVPGTQILQQILNLSTAYTALELSGIYESVDVDGNPITLSGKVILPADGIIKRYILVSHYTICSDREAPSNNFSLEGLLVQLGYALIIPDYLGYGVTAEQVHPYLMMDVTAHNVIDMYLAVVPYLKALGYTPEHNDIYLMGYSQGGAVTMAVQHLIEHHGIDIDIHRVFVGGGPYDVKYTYDMFVETDIASYPCAVPLMLQGMVVGEKLDLDMSKMMVKRIYENLDEWINSKRYTTGQINDFIGSNVTSDLLTEIGRDRTSKAVSELYKSMTNNSILTYSWTPQAPVFMMHSMNDEVVPFENAMRAKSKWKDANIQYHFGYFGGHQLTCVQFIYMVKTLLIKAENEENGKFEF